MTRSSKESFMEKYKMVRNNMDVVKDINEYIRVNKKLIDSEYNKVVNKSMDKESSDYEFIIASIYKEYLEYESYISIDVYMFSNANDVKKKISLFQSIFQTFHNIEELIERFKKAKQNFYMNK